MATSTERRPLINARWDANTSMADVQPLITTIIPTYQRADLLQRAIDSVLDQSYPHLRVCVYDNASNDRTPEVINALAQRDKRIRYYRHPRNIGAQENFRFGLSRVDTQLCNFLSDDDFLLPGFFDRAISAFRKYREAAFFFGGVLAADLDGEVITYSPFESGPEELFSPPQLFHLLAPDTRAWTGIIFRRTALDCLGGLRLEVGYASDTDLILRAATRYAAVLSDRPSAVYTVHPQSAMTAHFPEVFETQLNLAFFNSVNQAIDSAANDKIVSVQEAAEMKAVHRKLTEQNLFRTSFGLIARDRLSIAARTSEVLARAFERKDMATVIRLGTLDNGLGALVRLVIKSIRALRQVWFSRNRAVHHTAYSELVKARILQLASYQSNGTRISPRDSAAQP